LLRRMSPVMALRWHNLPCALKAAIVIGKRTSGDPCQSDVRRGAATRPITGPGAHLRTCGPMMAGGTLPAAMPTRAPCDVGPPLDPPHWHRPSSRPPGCSGQVRIDRRGGDRDDHRYQAISKRLRPHHFWQ
jgi:hypothetical protein